MDGAWNVLERVFIPHTQQRLHNKKIKKLDKHLSHLQVSSSLFSLLLLSTPPPSEEEEEC